MGLFDLFTGAGAAKAAKKGAAAQVAGLQQASGQVSAQQGQNQAAYAPFVNQGLAGLDLYGNALGLGGLDGQAQAQRTFQSSPGYQFQMDQGVQALDRSAAAQGGLLSGGAAKALTGFGQGLANQDYGQWLDRLNNVGQQGQQAVGQQQVLNSGLTGQLAGLSADIGTAKATGIVGAANAKQGAFNNLLGTAGQLFGFGL